MTKTLTLGDTHSAHPVLFAWSYTYTEHPGLNNSFCQIRFQWLYYKRVRCMYCLSCDRLYLFSWVRLRVRRFRTKKYFAPSETKWKGIVLLRFRMVFRNNGPMYLLLFALFQFNFFMSLRNEKKKDYFYFISLINFLLRFRFIILFPFNTKSVG
jgi:hypothetical protein